MSDLETELKFEIDQACAAGLIDRLSLSGGRGRRLRSVYYDTPDGDLAVAGFVLRIREEAGRKVQTIKQASADGGTLHRGEWETAVETAAPDLAAARGTPLKAHLKSRVVKALGPVFVIDVERRKCVVKVAGGSVEAALDRGEARTGGRAAPIHELELELKSGPTSVLFTLAEELLEAFPLNLSFTTKSERGRLLVDGDAPGPLAGRTPALAADANAAQAFRVIASGALAQIVTNAALLRASHGAPALHQTRVGLRRLRSAMSLFRPMLDGEAFDAVDDELKWLAGELDDARDLDVFTDAAFTPTAADGADEPGFDAFAKALMAAREQAYAHALAAVDSIRCRLLLLHTLAFIDDGAWVADPAPEAARWRARPIKALAHELLQARWRKVRRKGRKLADLDVAERHRLRIAGKKLRYAAGFFAGLYGDKAVGRFQTAASDLQDALGALTDIAAGRRLAQRVTAGSSDALADFAAGHLTGHRDADEARALKAALKAFKRFEAAKPFW